MGGCESLHSTLLFLAEAISLPQPKPCGMLGCKVDLSFLTGLLRWADNMTSAVATLTFVRLWVQAFEHAHKGGWKLCDLLTPDPAG